MSVSSSLLCCVDAADDDVAVADVDVVDAVAVAAVDVVVVVDAVDAVDVVVAVGVDCSFAFSSQPRPSRSFD